MKSRVFVFPGQGSQVVGMGMAFAEDAAGRALVEEAGEAIKVNLFKMMQDGPLEELTATQNAQPALLTAGVLALNYLKKCVNKPVEALVGAVAGHSLGEYTAVCAAGGMGFAQAVRLVRLRGEAMSRATGGAMAALLGVDGLEIKGLDGAGWVVANDNCPGQVVVSGPAEGYAAMEAAAKSAGAKRVMRLNVSGAFHTDAMRPAGEEVARFLRENPLTDLRVPCMMNATATLETGAAKVAEGLVAQVSGRVRWREGMVGLADAGVTEVVELGVGKVLSGMAGRCDARLSGVSLDSPAAVEDWLRKAGY